MKTLYFECTLLSDIILSETSASEGPQKTLSFIPGSNFLGIVARTAYPQADISAEDKMHLFHSGNVRFGDAHVSLSNFRSIQIPACLYYPKLEGPQGDTYIHHLIELSSGSKDNYRSLQLKQYRKGFFTFAKNEEEEFFAYEISPETRITIKSARDKMHRRSEDEKMFSYQSLACGAKMLFSVELTSGFEYLEKIVTQHLCGKKNIGRSKSAEYGLVEIKKMDHPFEEVRSSNKTLSCHGNRYVVVYADSRLIFWDEEFNLPCMRPTAEMLGIKGGAIDWTLSQVRTFRYSPFNFTRFQFDSDRYGFEKGSVFVVRCQEFCLPADTKVGLYKNEGFGKVIYNPEILITPNLQPKARLIFEPKAEQEDTSHTIQFKDNTYESNFLHLLISRKENTSDLKDVFKLVRDFVATHKPSFDTESMASQWGQIRNIAHSCENFNDFHKKVNDFLTHGEASNKWTRLNRLKRFNDFLEKPLIRKHFREAVVNLAAQMAK